MLRIIFLLNEKNQSSLKSTRDISAKIKLSELRNTLEF